MARGGRYAGFVFSPSREYDKDLSLLFEFQFSGLNGLIWGVAASREKIGDSKADDIKQVMDEAFGQARSSANWVWFAFANEKSFDGYRDWHLNTKPWLDIEDGTLAIRVAEIAQQFADAFSTRGKQHLLMPKPANAEAGGKSSGHASAE